MIAGSTESSPVSMAVIEAIADMEGVDPIDLDYPLHSYIDPDALDLLMENSESSWHLRATVADHSVTVDSDGTITVDGNEYRWDRGSTVAR